MRFKKLVFRRTVGNAITILEDLDQPILTYDGRKLEKCLYVVIFEDADTMRAVIRKVCEAFSDDM